MSARVGHVAALALALGLAVGACSSSSDSALVKSERALVPSTTGSAGVGPPSTRGEPCDPTASLRPAGSMPAPGEMPAGSYMRTIQDRGRLVVGVDENTLFFGARNPTSGELEGFEVDLLREIARAITGDPDAITFKTVVTSQKVPFVQQGLVDVTASLVSMTCERWRDVSFSTEYYEAYHQLLVPTGSSIQGIDDLADQRVCVTSGSTSVDLLARIAPDAIPHTVEARTDCLVALQDGSADAVLSHDTVLYGLHEQDPDTVILPERIAVQPYGMPIATGHPEFVRFVNALLERLRDDGTLAALDAKWLGRIRPSPPVPPARYRD